MSNQKTDGAVNDGKNGSIEFKASGFTGNSLGLPTSKPVGTDEILGYGDSKSF
jgi:hypothetical protein